MPSRGGLRIGGTRVHDPFGVDHRMTTGPRQALYVSDLERTLLRSDRLVLLRDRRVSGPSNLQGSIGANSRAMNCPWEAKHPGSEGVDRHQEGECAVSLPVRLTSDAVQDLAIAERWYLDEAPHVLASFEEEIDRAFRLISGRPELYQAVESTVPPRSGAEVPLLGLLPDPSRVDRGYRHRAPIPRPEDMATARLTTPRPQTRRCLTGTR